LVDRPTSHFLLKRVGFLPAVAALRSLVVTADRIESSTWAAGKASMLASRLAAVTGRRGAFSALPK